jgi:Tol biopolymer transport system component
VEDGVEQSLHRVQGVVLGDLKGTRPAAVVTVVSAVRVCRLNPVWGRVAHGLAFVVVLAVLGAAAGSAWASFPGRNGQIVYGWAGPSAYRAGPTAMSIRAVDPRTGRVRVLRDCPLLPPGYTECSVSAPRYSPDGRRIAFPTLRSGPTAPGRLPWPFLPGLGTMASDGIGFEERATERRYWALAWSPTGDRFLVQRQLGPEGGSGEFAIFLASLDGTELSQVTPEATQTPDWSSTGQIAFTRCRNPCPFRRYDVYVTRLGGTPRRLTYRGGYDPSWSPHGTKLAFVRADRSRRDVYRPDLYTVRRDGRGLRRLTRRGGSSPVWSPDGKWIAFVRGGDIYVVRSTGGGRRRVVNAPPQTSYGWTDESAGSPDWQPLPRR